MKHTATTALPYPEAERATMGLRGQLRYEIATARIAHQVDWSQLTVTGPVEVPGVLGRVWFEYAATISVEEPRRCSPAGHHDGGAQCLWSIAID
jgi:hypothetical protein